MIVLIAGATHTGKTALAQKLLEKYKYPYLSIDHIKMGLIRSKQTDISVLDDEKLVPYLWSIIKEIIKTAIENGQNLIIEGCYIPFDFKKYFEQKYLAKIKYYCLIMTENYICSHFDDIIKNESIIEKRLCTESDVTPENLIRENAVNLEKCETNGLDYILIDKDYDVDIDLL